MEKILLCEKAMGYSRKIAPALVHDKFELVENAKIIESEKAESVCGFERVKVKSARTGVLGLFFAFVFLIAIGYSICTFLMPRSEVAGEIHDVVEKLFEPRDLGKIKFANGDIFFFEDTEAEAMSMVPSIGMPFAVCVSKNLGDGFFVSSSGEITVRCALPGVVESIEESGSNFQKVVTVKHTAGLKTMYSMIDNVSVKVGDRVEKNTILGIALSGEIGFKVSYQNKIIKGLEIVDGQLSFV